MQAGFERKQPVYDVDFILPKILHWSVPRDESKIDIDGDMIKMNSPRLQTFKNSIHCFRCTLSGTFFAKERNIDFKGVGYHLNLYGISPVDGEEVLFTKFRTPFAPKTDENAYVTACQRCAIRLSKGPETSGKQSS